MLYEVWVIMLAMGIVLLLVTITLVFTLHIPELVDELSGKKAKRQIKRLKEMNAKSGALDGANTKDVYSVINTNCINTSEGYTSDITGSIIEEGVASITKEIKVITEEPEDIIDNSEDASTSYSDVGEDAATGIIGSKDEDEETSYVEESCVTGILEELEKSISDRRIVVVIKEQSSIKEDLE